MVAKIEYPQAAIARRLDADLKRPVDVAEVTNPAKLDIDPSELSRLLDASPKFGLPHAGGDLKEEVQPQRRSRLVAGFDGFGSVEHGDDAVAIELDHAERQGVDLLGRELLDGPSEVGIVKIDRIH
ncbi:hypothetical protein [Rhodopseudomonas pseudopalustris]|uniref:hypothetical protein n=1 Tax=Rhodopseudomonas pseudopalustris TaxID=1513892 RepID=UPI001588289F|nr:hypothetical protein [Rhodopseudomonas pseudopalustris]